MIEICRSGLLPEVTLNEDRPLTREDFVGCPERALESLNELYLLLINEEEPVNESSIPWILLLCGENCESGPWNDSGVISASFKVISGLKKRLKCSSVSQILRSNESYLDEILKIIDRNFNKNWKNFPGSVSCFVWILHQFNDLSGIPSKFLPFSLRFADDWQDEYKIKGILCLKHIVNHADVAELIKFGRLDVILEAFRRQTIVRSGDPDFADVIYPAYFAALAKIDRSESGFDEADKLTLILLEKLELEVKREVIKCLLKHFDACIRFQSIRLVRFLCRIIRIYAHILASSVHDRELRFMVLHQLQFVIQISQERVKDHCRDLLEMLFRRLFELSIQEKADDDEKLLVIARIKQVREIAQDEYELLCKGLNETKVNSKMNEFISEIYID